MLERKYNLPRHGWDVQGPPWNSSAIWKGILLVKRLFMENIRYQIGSGERTLLWKDRWASERELCAQFPDLFRCAQDKEATVSSHVSAIGGRVVWGPTFRRNLKDNEEFQFIGLLNSLDSLIIQNSRADARVWIASKNGSFSVSSFFKAILSNPRERSGVYSIWKL